MKSIPSAGKAILERPRTSGSKGKDEIQGFFATLRMTTLSFFSIYETSHLSRICAKALAAQLKPRRFKTAPFFSSH
jgi:hypothetical protein